MQTMDIISPASPMTMRLSSDVHKAATVFLSHVRRTFQRFPSDYTGELVRLLDDIAVVTRTLSAAVMDASSAHLTYGGPTAVPSGAAEPVTSAWATKHLYRALRNDGYCCIILSKNDEHPLTFADDVPHGNYVVCVSPLDFDEHGPEERAIAGTIFSVYKRRSSASLPGRGIDLKQEAKDQVAAGYCCYSSATTLHYTMGHGVHSFVLHPVALQYFLQPAVRVMLPDNASTIYCDRQTVLSGQSSLSSALQRCVDKFRGSTFTSGCLVGDLHMLLQTGGLLVAEHAHLLCEAAPVAMVIEQAGGVAVDESGNRILSLAVEEDHNVEVTLVVGSRLAVTHLQLGTGNPNGHTKIQVEFPDD